MIEILIRILFNIRVSIVVDNAAGVTLAVLLADKETISRGDAYSLAASSPHA